MRDLAKRLHVAIIVPIYEIEQDGDTVKLTVTHSIEKEKAKLIEAVSGGWPKILSSLKTYLETGTPLPRPVG